MSGEQVRKNFEDESKEERFKRVAELRVNKALDKIRLIGNLAHFRYTLTTEGSESIIAALREGVNEVERRFEERLGVKKQGFQLQTEKSSLK